MAQDQGRYKIVRVYGNSPRKTTLKRNLSLEEAQAHCSDPETSWRTCTTSEGRRRTRNYGTWFDCYYAQ